MKLIIAKNYDEMSELAAHMVIAKMLENRKINLSLTAGKTPAGFYKILVPAVKNKDYYSNVHYYNFDEISIKGERFGLTMSLLSRDYYEPAVIPKDNIHELNEKNFENYDQILEDAGGLDLVLLGIGADGHFCGNVPGYTKFNNKTNITDLIPGTRIYEELHQLMGKEPGEWAVTFGPKTVMNARQIIMIANGKSKATAIKKALEGEVDENVPSSVLQLHPNYTVIIDEEAASELERLQ